MRTNSEAVAHRPREAEQVSCAVVLGSSSSLSSNPTYKSYLEKRQGLGYVATKEIVVYTYRECVLPGQGMHACDIQFHISMP